MSLQPFPSQIPLVDGVGKLTPFGLAALNALVTALGGSNSKGLNTAQVGGVAVISGAGSPAGTVSASPGTLYLNTKGGAGATFWIKETGTEATGWAAK